MSYNPGQGEIITIRDFIDMMVYYTMQPEPDYQSKITVICSDGVRMNVYKDKVVGMNSGDGFVYLRPDWSNSGIPSNVWYMTPSSFRINGGSRWNGLIPYFYTSKGRSTYKHSVIVKILDPADNSIFDGVENHIFNADIPTAGELISIPDMVNFLSTISTTVYKTTDVFVYEWRNNNWTNDGDFNPHCVPWYSSGGGPGWSLLNSWYYSRLDTPSTYGIDYNSLPSSLKLSEDQYISTDQLQSIASALYQSTLQRNKGITETIHVLSCHKNCHESCHCARW